MSLEKSKEMRFTHGRIDVSEYDEYSIEWIDNQIS